MAKTIMLDGKRISYCGKRNEEKLQEPDVYTIVKKEKPVKVKQEKKTLFADIESKTSDGLSFDNIEIKGEIE